ncbi:MAG TPA: glycosyltransferase family 9 protein [Ktedonobacterales bacterium]|nr:glycosyltransferase family 9 protein [Ktedonobacterales bacterium]
MSKLAQQAPTQQSPAPSSLLPAPTAPTRQAAPRATPTFHLRREPRRILVTALCPIGDTLFLTPALAALRRRFPQAQIIALLYPSNAGILDGNTDVDAWLLAPERGAAPVALRYLRAVWRLAHERYDLIVNFSAAGSITTALAALRAPRLGLRMPPFWMLVGNHSAEYRARHAIDHYFKAIEALIPIPTDPDERVPRLALSPADRTAARDLLRAEGVPAGKPLVTLHVGGDGYNGRKRWAPERFAEVARRLIARFDCHILLVGGAVDLPMSEETARLIGQTPDEARHVHLLIGRTSLKLTGALIAASALFIGNDSSPMHIAAAMRTPTVGIFGPSDWQEFYPVGGVGYQSRVLHSDLPCYPCFRFVGNDPYWYRNPCYTYACLKAIQPQDVFDAAVELLRGDGAAKDNASLGVEVAAADEQAPRAETPATDAR